MINASELTYEVEYDNSGFEHFTFGFTIARGDYDTEQGRQTFDWTITQDGIVKETSLHDWDAKIRSGVGAEPGLSEIMGTLFSFLGAWAEGNEHEQRTGRDSENSDIFSCVMLADLLESFSSDDFAMMADEINGSGE